MSGIPESPEETLATAGVIFERYGADESGLMRHNGTTAAEVLELDPHDPLRIARLFVQRKYTRYGIRTLHHHLGTFHVWNGRCYAPLNLAEVRSAVYDFLECASRQTIKGEPAPLKPNRVLVSNVIDALQAVTNLPAAIRPPAWLQGAPASAAAAEIVPCANGLLHLPTGKLLPPTPTFFSLNAVDFDFDKHAPQPERWLKFLTSLWPDDPEAINALQEWFGYLLTTDTRQQKILLIVGPKRSGKGTLARVLTALIGQPNVCAPTLATLAQNFGLSPLIGKQLAIIADARLGARTDQHAVAERLLSISGEDGITIDRKYIEPWTGHLSTRFAILTNELPRLADVSGALVSRFIILTLRHSFLGREDLGLTERLLQELPGIMNWAIEGWRRLRERGYFVQPGSSDDAIQELEDLGSPIGAFLRECCEVAPGKTVNCALLFAHWCVWCEDQGRDHPGTVQSFGRDLRTAVPSLRTVQPRSLGAERGRRYEGIGLQTDLPTGVTVRAEAIVDAKSRGSAV
jgi:putative DNA primase/helicase